MLSSERLIQHHLVHTLTASDHGFSISTLVDMVDPEVEHMELDSANARFSITEALPECGYSGKHYARIELSVCC